MLTTVYSAKGGQGTTTVAVTLAALTARSLSVTLIDAADHGDIPAVLGHPAPGGPGFAEWSNYDGDDPIAAFWRLGRSGRSGFAVTLEETTSLHSVHRGSGAIKPRDEITALGATATLIMDCGLNHDLAAMGEQRLMVLRPDYMALKWAVSAPTQPTGVILIEEPGRSLNGSDVESVIGVPVVARLPYDPVVQRAVDAGVLVTRVPASLRQPLQPIRFSPKPRLGRTDA